MLVDHLAHDVQRRGVKNHLRDVALRSNYSHGSRSAKRTYRDVRTDNVFGTESWDPNRSRRRQGSTQRILRNLRRFRRRLDAQLAYSGAMGSRKHLSAVGTQTDHGLAKLVA
jgi:hypothetical protein